MIRRGWILGGLFALLPATSQAGMAMLVEGVPGPSTLLNHVGWFDLEAVQWSIQRSKVAEPYSFSVVLESSAALSTLLQASASGTGLKKIVVDTVFTTTNVPVVLDSRLTCEEPFIRDFSAAGSGQDRERVNLTLQCGRILWEKFDYTSTGQPLRQGKGSWNFKTNTP